ncbi:MAG: hypothetical protein R3332_08805 [Pseudohongiellaceae bacterium]|nr:hypothetical protein [Pseudohongiellaceae bacterium]
MKCVYYLSPSLKSTQQISDDLHSIGVDDWFLHIVSKDESGLSKERLHSSNYLETLDVIRDGLIGAGLGFCVGLLAALLAMAVQPFGTDIPLLGYIAIVFVCSCFGAWVGGLVGIASENKKLANFHDDIAQGKYLILIYAKKGQDDKIQKMMSEKHGEARLAAVDAHFLNPFAQLKLSSAA